MLLWMVKGLHTAMANGVLACPTALVVAGQTVECTHCLHRKMHAQLGPTTWDICPLEWRHACGQRSAGRILLGLTLHVRHSIELHTNSPSFVADNPSTKARETSELCSICFNDTYGVRLLISFTGNCFHFV